MAGATSLNLGTDEVRAFAAQLKAYHAKETLTGQNDGSNDTDDIHDNLELSDKRGEMADLRGMYGEMDARGRLDLAALCILGMDEAENFEEAMDRARDRNGPDLDALREMPLSPGFILSGLDRMGGNSDAVEATRGPDAPGSGEA